jgi:cell division protease FtsH
VIFNKISTGAQNDLDRVTKMAYDMITIYGMNDSVGQVSFYSMSQDTFQRPYSDQTATLIDNQVRQLVESQYQRAQQLLTEKRDQLEILANALLDKEVILKSDVVRLIGPRPYDVEDIPQNGLDSMLEGVGDHTTEETPTVEEAAN